MWESSVNRGRLSVASYHLQKIIGINVINNYFLALQMDHNHSKRVKQMVRFPFTPKKPTFRYGWQFSMMTKC